MNIADVLKRHAGERPDALAVLDGETGISYRRLDQAVGRAATRLKATGVAPGDIVGVSMPNSALHLVAVYALARIGAVQIALSIGEPLADRRIIVDRFAVRTVIATDSREAPTGVRLLPADPDWLQDGSADVVDSDSFDGTSNGWAIVLSSGTTGDPKGTLQTHVMQLAVAERNRHFFPLGPSDRYLATIGLPVGWGLRIAMQVIFSGGAVVLPRPGTDWAGLDAIIDALGITYLVVLPVDAEQMLQRAPSSGLMYPGLRFLQVGAATCPPELRRQIEARLTPNLYISYGTNEVSRLTAIGPGMHDRWPGSVGRPLPGVDVEIVDELGNRLGGGETGQVRVRTPVMPTSYFNDGEATRRSFRDGWFYPGDLGLLSPDGALFLRGRVDDLINFDGTKVAPIDIETVLLQHPSVAEAAAFPFPWTQDQIVPAAVVVLRQPETARSLHAFCRARLGKRAPVVIEVAATLPKNALGKTLKNELARALQHRMASSAGASKNANPGGAGV